MQYEASLARPSLSLTPVLNFWQARGVKLTGIVVLAALFWGLYTLFTAPAFFVYGAEIRGTAALSTREIYLVSGIDSQNIFWLNPTIIARQVMTLPNIKSATAAISLPARVVITVVERKPQLLWQTGDKIWWVDEDGIIVPPRTEVEDMLKIIDDDLTPMEVGYQIDPNIIGGAQALRLLAPEVSLVRHTRAQGLVVSTPEGWPVYLGDGSQMRAKLVVLSALLPDLREQEDPPLYIDVRNPLMPVYKLKTPVISQPRMGLPKMPPLVLPPAPQPVRPPQRQP
jgi:cell division septal protein FtsQ